MEEIFLRTSVRDFLDRPVEEEKSKLLLHAAMAAPSSGNEQPWEFIVVTNRETCRQLSKVNPWAGCIARAPLVIVTLMNRKRLDYPENGEMDMSAALENMLLEATHLELGAVWISVAPQEDRIRTVQRIFDLPEYLVPFAVVPCGYPVHPPQMRGNRYDASRVHYEKL